MSLVGAYKNGYNYAAGALLSRQKTTIAIRDEFNEGGRDPFYEGMRQALEDYLGAFEAAENHVLELERERRAR